MLNITALLPIMKNMFQIVIVYFKTLKVFYKLIGSLFLFFFFFCFLWLWFCLFPFFFFFGFAGVRLFISYILMGGVKLLTVEFFPLESSVRLAF